MSSDPFGFTPQAQGRRPAIRVENVSKHYVMFERPEDRFKQMVVPRLQRLVGRPGRRYFRDFAALNGVSLEIGRGETVGIIGRNGSGKSTLLQIICGTLQPTSGSVEVNGRIAALLELGAGFNPEFTGRENVFLNAQILGVPRQEMEWRFDDIARFADIGPFLDQPVKTYSSGMYVRLAFATAINVDPDILVVDEALSVGDEAFQRKCFARIEDIKDKGGTILFVSHGAQTIVQLCTRAILIDGGEKLLEGAPKRVVGQYQRLVNASAESTSEIRAQIIAMRDAPQVEDVPEPVEDLVSGLKAGGVEPALDPASIPVEGSVGSREKVERFSPVPQTLPADDILADYFDPNLISQSTTHFKERGAHIREVRITTLGGEQVNVLAPGRRYVFRYYIDFDISARNVGFSYGIRTISGLLISGISTFQNSSTRQRLATAGTSFEVAFEFKCSLLPGTYFAVCGSRGFVDEDEVLFHRIIDAVCFRVASEGATTLTGLCDLDVVHTLTEDHVR